MAVDFYKPLAFSLALALIASVWVLKYGAARRGRSYAEQRLAIGRDDSFRVLGKVIFVAMNALTVFSFWRGPGLPLLSLPSDLLRIAGLIVLGAATLLYMTSMSCLGDNYSPFFDAHLPHRIVMQGPYRYIRHPIYLANVLQGVGYTLASGSLWVLFLAAYGSFSILRALRREECYLSRTFSGYEGYRGKTARLIPFIY